MKRYVQGHKCRPTASIIFCVMVDFISLVPRPSPSFPSLYHTASDGKLGTRLRFHRIYRSSPTTKYAGKWELYWSIAMIPDAIGRGIQEN